MPNIIVCMKQALDVSEIKIDKAAGVPILQGVSMKINDFDKNAIEEAVRLRTQHGGKVSVLTVTPQDAKKALREALAMGADEAYMIADSLFEKMDALVKSRILAEGIKKIGNFDLILCGEVSIDGYTGQMGSRIAERLGIPQIGYVRKLTLKGEREVVAESVLEDSIEVVEAQMPLLVSVGREINEPRIPSYMDIMKASKKPSTTWSAKDIGITEDRLKGSLQVLETIAPIVERKRVVIKGENAGEIAGKLVNSLAEERVLR